MARRVKDALLDGRTARSALKPSGKPYFRALEHGLHLSYRKPLSGPGKWGARHYLGNREYTTELIGEADDFSDADGIKIINYDQAIKKARQRSVERAHDAAGKTGPLTVADVMRTYLEFLETERKSAVSARYSINAHILPDLGGVEVQALTKDQLKKWHNDLAKKPIRLRAKEGCEPRFKLVDNSDDGVRRRKSTANRILKILKGALNFAWRDGKVLSDSAWRRVTPFKGVESARIRYLTVAESQRLLNAAQQSNELPEFRRLVEGALQTGARYSELSKMVVSDLNPDVGTVAVPDSKGGKSRHIVLTNEG
nr:tyrosine-type recombinase/integrase [Bradyrhizobium sp.]